MVTGKNVVGGRIGGSPILPVYYVYCVLIGSYTERDPSDFHS